MLRFLIVRGGSRPLSAAFVAASVLGLIAIPVYLDFATASDSLKSVFDVGALVPLFRVTAFGRGYTDMLLCFALFCVAGWIALWLDRADRPLRSVAELATTESGRRVHVGGLVTHRQRPGTAMGVTFLNLEDETGMLNVVCSVGLMRAQRQAARNKIADLAVRDSVAFGRLVEVAKQAL